MQLGFHHVTASSGVLPVRFLKVVTKSLISGPARPRPLIDGVILDCMLPPGGKIITVYIAITRVRERGKLLIIRAFPLEDFQKGIRGARELLLDCWRGSAPDWDAVRTRYNVSRRCVDCLQEKRKIFFTSAQWRATNETRVCKECVALHRDEHKPWRCSRCLLWQAVTAFPTASFNNKATWKRVCNSCRAARRCSRCDKLRGEKEFSKFQWGRSAGFYLQCAYKTEQVKQVNAGCSQPPRFARAQRFVRRSRRRMCVRAVKREIAALIATRQQAAQRRMACPTCGAIVETRQKLRSRVLSS